MSAVAEVPNGVEILRNVSHRHTDARDHNTFCVVYDSRKM